MSGKVLSEWEKVRDRNRRRFEKDVTEHRLEVLHEDGLYRHLRFVRPTTGAYWFDLVTWPGNLAIRGDMGSHVFAQYDAARALVGAR